MVKTEKHVIEFENSQEISAVHHKTRSDRWVFFCHGFGSNKKGSYEERCKAAVENGWNAVRFDFRGNGESSGEFINQNLTKKIEDLKAVIEFFEPENYVLFGNSFGGKTVLHSASDLKPEKIVLKAPVTYNSIMDKYRAAVKNKGVFEHISGKPIDSSFFEDFDQYSFEETAEKIDVPVLLFHGSADTTVHPEQSLEAGKILDDITIWKLKDEKHSFSEEAEKKMRKQMFNWLN